MTGTHRSVADAGGAVAAAHPLAAEAAAEILREGGSAVDAAVAAQAVICAVMPQAAGLGGDLLALVRTPDRQVTAVNGTGCSPHEGFLLPPGHPEAPPGTDVAVPGLVAAWEVCVQRWGRLPLATDLAPAVRSAADGCQVDPALAAATDRQRERLVRGGADRWSLLGLPPGATWRQPEVAALLSAIGAEGAAAFYRGRVADDIARAARRLGGRLTAEDLHRHTTVVADPIVVAWAGGRLHLQPPMSQGVLVGVAAMPLETGTVRWLPERGDHLMVELTEAAFELRSQVARGAALLDETLMIDEERAAHRGGPRAYLHTAAVSVADATGMLVTSLLSVFDDFGSAVFVPEHGIVLNNRAAGFTRGANAPAAAARPVHTLAPVLYERDGDVLGLATPGADGQVQTLLQVLGAMRYAGSSAAAAIGAPRWRSEGGQLMIEAGHPAEWDLRRRGHDVVPRPPGEDRFGAVAAAGLVGGIPTAYADWRRTVAVASAGASTTATASGTEPAR